MTFLYTVIAILIFITLLCLFIILSEKILGQSGEIEVCINSDTKFKANRGLKLLSVLAENKIYLPAACGGKGNCGKCKLNVLSGGGAITSLEKVALSEEEINKGFRLACQVKLRENINLDIPKSILNARSFKAKLIKKDNLAYKIKELRFKIENEEKLNFKAGQYIQINKELPRENVIRAYSLSSSPDDTDEFSLDVQLVEGGIVSPYLHSLEIGSVIDFCGPFVDMFFDIKANKAKTIVLVAGGVGLAPMRSIVSNLSNKQFEGNMVLFHGVRSKKHLYSEKEYKKLQKELDNFEYHPVLSEPALEDGWIGETGLVTHSLEKWLIENESSVNNIEVYLCGPSKMMEASEKLLISKGVEAASIHSDPFSY